MAADGVHRASLGSRVLQVEWWHSGRPMYTIDHYLKEYVKAYLHIRPFFVGCKHALYKAKLW